MSDMSDLLSMAKSEDPMVRAMVARSIAPIQDSQVVSALTDLLSDPDERVQITAVTALGQNGNPVAVEALLPLLENGSVDAKCAVLAALAQIPSPRAFAPIVVRLFDVDDEIRKNAAAAIGRLRDPRALEPLLVCLDDTDDWVRANSAWSLGQIGCFEAASALCESALCDEEFEEARANAATSLGVLCQEVFAQNNAEQIEAALQYLNKLFEIFDDESATPKTLVAFELALANAALPAASVASDFSKRVYTMICELVGNNDEDVRSTAVWCLGLLFSKQSEVRKLLDEQEIKQARELLQSALYDEHEWCVKYAKEALVEFSE